MTDGSVEPPGLAPGERVRAQWPAEWVGAPGTKLVSGFLFLTSERCLFYRRAGVFGGGKPDGPPTFTVGLADLRSIVPCSFPVPIGYGDRYFLPGIELNGTAFRFGRELSSASIISAIEAARSPSGTPPVA